MSTVDPTRYKPSQAFIEAETRKIEAEEKLREELQADGGVFGRMLSSIGRFFGVAFEYVWSGFNDILSWVTGPMADWFTGTLLKPKEEEISHLLGWMADMELLDANDRQQLEAFLQNAKHVGGWLAGPITAVILARSFFAFTDVVGATAVQRLNKKYSPTVPVPETIARTSFIAPELHARVVDAMKRSGLSQEDIELLFVSLYALQNPAEIMQLFWRGKLDKDAAINRMQELGYTPTRVAELMSLWERIPNLSDVIRYLGKEAFEPAMIQKFGLLEDYPKGEAEKWAAMNGYAPEWTEKEWISHWRDIGVTPALEGLHRRVRLSNGDLIDQQWIDDYLRLIEIPGPVRELIHKTSFNPYTRVDARRMHDMGVLDDEELVGVYMDQGYDLEHATNMALFTIRYNQREGKTFTRADVEKGYEDGDLSYDQAGTYLVQAGYDADYAEYLLRRVDIEKARAHRLDAIEVIKARFLSHLIPQTEARNQLISIGLSGSRISELLSRWEVQQINNTKLPSKTDLDKMLKQGIIDEREYRQQMTYLGYKQEYLEWYISLAKSTTEG
jgi:hypothetical protein